MGLLHPLPILVGVWQDLSMDFIEGLPKSQGYNVILIVVDILSKYAHFIALKHPYTAHSIAQTFMDNIVKLHGLPNSIITDRDTVFLSAFWKELFKLYKVNLQFSTTCHPKSDGQTERVNQCLEMYLRCAVHDSPNNLENLVILSRTLV
jgi:transposase InsO family protein